MAVDVLLGLQWGDEGKGKIVDYLALSYDVIARFQGGPNAGHTILLGKDKYILHTIPSGIFQDGLLNLIGNGVVLDPVVLKKEIAMLKEHGIPVKERLRISRKAHLILPTHRLLDAASEQHKGDGKIGSTLKGIGPAYMDKTGRNGLRVGDIELDSFREHYRYLVQKHQRLLQMYEYDGDMKAYEEEWFEGVAMLQELPLVDGEYFINEQLREGKHVLAEGAQGAMLDNDFGTYPYVTSSNTITAAACTGLGVSPHHIREVIGITKAYCTRVGNGPFPSELHNDTGEALRKQGHEFGSTTGRPRRCGWLDLPALQYSIMLNGVTKLALTKVDVLNDFDPISVCSAYRVNGKTVSTLPFNMEKTKPEPVWQELDGWKTEVTSEVPAKLESFLTWLEDKTSVPLFMISVGPERNQILRRDVKPTV